MEGLNKEAALFSINSINVEVDTLYIYNYNYYQQLYILYIIYYY